MGTGNLTCVYHDSQFKLAKYCQWDGYPEGQGKKIVKFLVNEFDRSLFLKNLDSASIASEEELEEWDLKKYPHFSRDVGAGILPYIQNNASPKLLPSSIDFAANSLFCEWCYVVNLDDNVLEVYRGFTNQPLTESDRFFFLQHALDCDRFPVKIVASFDLSDDLEAKFEEFCKLN
jgi:hypothetical protein